MRGSGPLSGCRVLDLSAFMAGPLATMLLAEQGADVIRVEPRQGDLMRRLGTHRGGVAAMFVNSNRGKRSLCIDLKHPRGLEIVRRLSDRSDVFVENFRPGVSDRLGLGARDLHKSNPRLVYASVTGFGAEGPRASRPVFDTVIQGYSGLASVQGGESSPTLVRSLVADKISPLVAAQAITAALWEREHSGQGQHVQISMLDTLIWWLWPDSMVNHTFLGDGAVETPLLSSGRGLFRTADGFIIAIPLAEEHWAAFARIADRPEWLTTPPFATLGERIGRLDFVIDAIQAELLQRSSAEWLRALEAADIPCGPVHGARSLIEDEHVRSSGLFVELSHPRYGSVRAPRSAASFDRSGSPEPRPAPTLGENTHEVLAEIGLSQDEIEMLASGGVVT